MRRAHLHCDEHNEHVVQQVLPLLLMMIMMSVVNPVEGGSGVVLQRKR